MNIYRVYLKKTDGKVNCVITTEKPEGKTYLFNGKEVEITEVETVRV